MTVLMDAAPQVPEEGPDPTVARPHHRADVQGLRALAVTLVVAFHAGLPIPGGFIGVDVFFVISGFVIGGLLARQLGATSKGTAARGGDI